MNSQPPAPPGNPFDSSMLFRRYGKDVERFIRRLGEQGPDVEDQMQEVFLRAHKRGGFVGDLAQAKTWLFAIAVNVRRERIRNARRKPSEPDQDAIESSVSSRPSPEDDVGTRETIAQLEKRLKELSDDEREAFVIIVLEEESYASASVMLGVEVGTVASRVNRAKKKLAETLSSSNEPQQRRKGRRDDGGGEQS